MNPWSQEEVVHGPMETRMVCTWNQAWVKGTQPATGSCLLWAVLPDCSPLWHVPNPSWCHGQCLSPPGHPAPQGSSHTCVLGGTAEETNFLEVAGRGDRQGHDIADGLMEARVGPAAEGDGLVLVLQVVLDVAHLVVHCEQLLHGHRCALLDPDKRKQSID